MKKSRPNPHLVKIHRNYTVEEVARLFNIHKNTVRNWISGGLPVCDSNRPLLVLGSALRLSTHYLENRELTRHLSSVRGCDESAHQSDKTRHNPVLSGRNDYAITKAYR
jgi:hypothetical protein